MTRTRLRVVLILLVLILIVASILSGLLTYWVGASDVPPSTPSDGEAEESLQRFGRGPILSWHPEWSNDQPLHDACFTS